MKILAFPFFLFLLPISVRAGSIPIPCEEVGSENKVIATAIELASRAFLKQGMTGCRIPRGRPSPIFATSFNPIGNAVLIFSQEVEDQMSDAALQGLIGHEIGHMLTQDHDEAFWQPLTKEQRFNQELKADAVAATLAGNHAIRRAMDEYQKLSEEMARRSNVRLTQELKKRRERLKRLK